MDIETKRRAAQQAITAYHKAVMNFCTLLIQHSANAAMNQFHTAVNKTQDEELKKLREKIKKNNNDSIYSSLLIDIVLSTIVIPGIGVLASRVLTSGIAAIVTRRMTSKKITEDLVKISNRMMKEGVGALDPKEDPDLYKSIYNVVKRHHTQKAIKDLDNKKYLEYFSDFFSDSSQAASQLALKLQGQPAPQPTKKTPEERFGKLTPVTALQVLEVGNLYMEMGKFVQTQARISFNTEQEDLTLVNHAIDEEYLDLVTKDFNASFQEIRFEDKDLTDKLTQVFEAIVWIHYLGDPDDWASRKLIDSEEGLFRGMSKEAPTTIESEKRPKYHEFEPLPEGTQLVRKYSRIEPGEEGLYRKEQIGPRTTYEPVVIAKTWKYYYNIPQSLFDYFLNRFYAYDTTESWIGHHSRIASKRRRELGKQAGIF
jgi:hypothetical protein